VSPGDVASNSRTLLQVGAPRGSAVLEALEHNAPYTKNEIFSAIAQIRREWRENAAGGSDSDTMVTPDAVPRFFENKIVSELPKSGQELRAIFVRYSCMLDLVLAQLRVVERSSSPHKRHLTSSPLPYNMSAPNKAFQKYQSGSVAYVFFLFCLFFSSLSLSLSLSLCPPKSHTHTHTYIYIGTHPNRFDMLEQACVF